MKNANTAFKNPARSMGDSIIKMVSFERFEKFKPHLSQIMIQGVFGSMYVIVRSALINGMNSFVLVTYRLALASLTIAPFAYILERKERPPLTWPLVFQIFLLGSGLETVNIKSIGGQAKVVGTIICVCGAMVMTLYKGPVLNALPHGIKSHRITSNSEDNNIVLGAILIFISVVLWSACIAFQAPILKRYPAQLSLTALTSLFGAVESAVVAVICQHKKFNIWAIGWNIKVFSVVYAGLLGSALGMYFLSWGISKRGPVFVALFNPVGTIVTAVLELIVLHVYLRVGSVVGAVFIVAGLYCALWGKAQDMKTEDDKAPNNNIIPQEAQDHAI